jgi:type VI protein secretion system component VasK
MDFMVEFVGEFVVCGVLAVMGAGVVIAVSALFHLPWLTRALVTGDNTSITLLAIIGLIALIGAVAAITWLVRRIRKNAPPSDAGHAGECEEGSTAPHPKGQGRHRSGHFGGT